MIYYKINYEFFVTFKTFNQEDIGVYFKEHAVLSFFRRDYLPWVVEDIYNDPKLNDNFRIVTDIQPYMSTKLGNVTEP